MLALQEGETVMDATLGSGGHARPMAQAVGTRGRLIALDQDPASIERCMPLFTDVPQAVLKVSNFVQADSVLEELNIPSLDAVLIDTGFSSDQLEDPSRGLSFDRNGPLDMRLDPSLKVTAKDLVNGCSEAELEKIFREYGEDRFSRKFAKVIVEERRKKVIETTADLVQVLAKALPAYIQAQKGRRPPSFRRHFATRVFQSLRIAVNDELKNLEKALKIFWHRLKFKGRLVVITFHSLEDRIVKNFFREKKQLKDGMLLSKKPVTASMQEIQNNPRSRSAKLRGVQRVR